MSPLKEGSPASLVTYHQPSASMDLKKKKKKDAMRNYDSKFYFLMHSFFLDTCTIGAMDLLHLLLGLSRKHTAMPLTCLF